MTRFSPVSLAGTTARSLRPGERGPMTCSAPLLPACRSRVRAGSGSRKSVSAAPAASASNQKLDSVRARKLEGVPEGGSSPCSPPHKAARETPMPPTATPSRLVRHCCIVLAAVSVAVKKGPPSSTPQTTGVDAARFQPAEHCVVAEVAWGCCRGLGRVRDACQDRGAVSIFDGAAGSAHHLVRGGPTRERLACPASGAERRSKKCVSRR